MGGPAFVRRRRMPGGRLRSARRRILLAGRPGRLRNRDFAVDGAAVREPRASPRRRGRPRRTGRHLSGAFAGEIRSRVGSICIPKVLRWLWHGFDVAFDMTGHRWDIVFRGPTLFDGTGAAPSVGDLAVLGDRITAIGEIEGAGAAIEIDAHGLALAPGFIDVHSHDDFAVLTTPAMDFKLMQGVTSEVVGNCGMGAAPYPAVREHFSTFFGNDAMPGWEGYRGYLEMVEREPPSLNVAMLVGHNTVRAAVMGMARRAPTHSELHAMRELVREGLEAGAVGLSTGLIYEPGVYCATEEVIELARDVAESGGVYATHMRNEASGLLDAVGEALRIGHESGVRVQISHHKAAGKKNWGRVRELLRLIEQARARMEEAVHRMTGMPAQKFGLADRGVLRAGNYADLVLFDPATVIDTGTFKEPKRYPAGISDVFVNGVAVVANGRHTGARPGRALRRN